MTKGTMAFAAILLAYTCVDAAEAPKSTAPAAAAKVTASPEPKALKKVDAKYPDELKKADIEGKTELKAPIKLDGTVGAIQPVACQATKNGKPLVKAVMEDACRQFVKASREAFAQWKYPARARGDTTSVVVTARFKFFIDKSKLPTK